VIIISFFGLFYKPTSASIDYTQNQGVQIQFIDIAPLEIPSPQPSKRVEEIVSNEPDVKHERTKNNPEITQEAVNKKPDRKDSVPAQPNLKTQTLIPAKFTPQLGGKFPAPLYPRWAKQQGVHGHLLLRVRVGVSGEVVKVEIEESSGNNDLDQFAVDWVAQRWTWPKGFENIVLVPFVFELK
jgi:protein TonB